MNLPNLSKEQQQYVVLGLLGTATVVALAVLGVRFSMSSVTSAKEELAGLTDKIQSAERTLSRRTQAIGDLGQTMDSLKRHLANALPERNYYSWATEVIYSKAREVGLEIDTIDEVGVPQSKPRAKGAEAIRFEVYSLRITAHGGYDSAKTFIERIRQDYPLVRFTGIDINSGSKPEIHDIQIFMQWPFNLGSIAKIWESVELKQSGLEPAENESDEVDAKPEPKPVLQPAPVKPEPAPMPEPTPPEPRVDVEPAPKKSIAPMPEVVPSLPATPSTVEPEPAVRPEPAPEPVSSVEESDAVEAIATAEDAVQNADLPATAVDPVEESLPVNNEPVDVQPDGAADTQTAGGAEEVSDATGEATPNYVSTEKSASKLKALFAKKSGPKSDATLGGLLDDLLEDVNETE